MGIALWTPTCFINVHLSLLWTLKATLQIEKQKWFLKSLFYALGARERLSMTVARFKINQIKRAWVQTVKIQNPQAVSTRIINFTHHSTLPKIRVSFLNLKASRCIWIYKILSGNSIRREKLVVALYHITPSGHLWTALGETMTGWR